MAEESERVGGISVDITGTDKQLEAALDAAEAKIKAWVQKVNASYSVKVGASTPQGGGGKGGGAGAPDMSGLERQIAALTQAVSRGGLGAARQARVEAEQVTINGVKVGRLSNLGSSLQKAIGPVEIEADTSAAMEHVDDLRVSTAKPIAMTLDNGEFMAAIKEMTAAVVSLKEQLATVQPPTSRRSGGGGRSTRAPQQVTAADVGMEDEEAASGNQGGRIQIIRQPQTSEFVGSRYGNQGGRIRMQRPISGTGIPIQRGFRVAISPYQRAAEQQQRERERLDKQASIEAQAAAARAEQEALMGLSAQNEAEGLGTRTSSTFAPHRAPGARVPTNVEEMARRKEQEAVRAAQYANITPQQRAQWAREARERERIYIREEQRARASSAAYTTAPRGLGGTTRRATDEEIERAGQERLAIREATQVSAGRTARTGASSLGSFALGGGRERIRAEQDLSVAIAKRKRDERDVAEAERFANRPEVIANARNRRDALDDLAAAQQKLKKSVEEEGRAREKVETFSSFGSGARNLLAVTAAGAAFGLGLQAISVAWSAAEKAAAPYIDMLTGYAQKTSDVTSALADQTRAQQGNAKAVVAARLAASGFSQEAASTIQPLIQQRAQVEAGNKALVEQIETFRIAENLRKQNPNAGIGGGGTGGIAGTGLFGIPSAGEQVGNFLKSLNDISLPISGSASGAYQQGNGYRVPGVPAILPSSMVPGSENTEALTKAAVQRGLDFLNSQIQKGGGRSGAIQQGGTDAQVAQFKQAFAGVSPEMQAAADELRLFSTQITNTDSALRALNQINIAGTITGPAELLAGERARQQNAANSVEAIRARQQYEQTSFTESLKRQAAIAIGTTLPASAALANLAAPPTPVGTGIKGTNAAEAKKIRDYTAETQTLQDSLNAYYAKGRAIIENTYKPAILQTFGQAGVQAFSDILTQVTAVGKEMSTIQAGISNEQAAYQAKQYSYQLFIAKRTLSDIAGLTGKNFGVGKSELGVLEGQNLALSRQAQQLTFMLNQRQINLQKALAGFVVPGLTPAEQNARVQEAKIEADYAQKQLDIQKQMFGNQVKIVDISNLRQGADLVKQIALLQEGRKVTLDTQLAQEKLTRLAEMQQALSAEAGVYITTVNQQIAKAEANMTEIEAATGQRITRIMKQGITAAYAVGHAFFLGVSGGFLGDSGSSPTGKVGGQGGGSQAPKLNASGALFNTRGATSLGPYGIAGEANTETVAILRNPRRFMAEGMGGGGGSVNFYGDINVRSEADIEALVRKITAAQGRRAALSGLRGPN